MKYGTVLLGVLAGTIVGGAIGLLFAPDKGANTRKNISEQGKKYSQALESKYNGVLEGLAKKYDSVKESGKTA
ncbi:MAG: YtxH domain-containing protein [Cyclobacteriaceae bacterium]|nr:YtxH domain-containing protein [Cyclobacteriaceae bacterium]